MTYIDSETKAAMEVAGDDVIDAQSPLRDAIENVEDILEKIDKYNQAALFDVTEQFLDTLRDALNHIEWAERKLGEADTMYSNAIEAGDYLVYLHAGRQEKL